MPGVDDCAAVDLAAEARDAAAHLLVLQPDGEAAMMLGAAGRIDGPERATNAARSSAAATGSSRRSSDAVLPATQRTTLHGYGKRPSGSPLATGIGTASGRRGARTESHLRSLATLSTAQWMRGSRTASSSPRRYIALSVPADSTLSMGSSAHCGCWVARRCRTNASSVSISSACILGRGTTTSLARSTIGDRRITPADRFRRGRRGP